MGLAKINAGDNELSLRAAEAIRSQAENGVLLVGEASYWLHTLVFLPQTSPPQPGTEAPAVLDCRCKVHAKRAMECTLLTHWELILLCFNKRAAPFLPPQSFS